MNGISEKAFDTDGGEAALFADDPNWAACIPEMKSGGPKCGMPAHEDCTPLDPDSVAGHLAPGGTLGTMAGYEMRPGQVDMLKSVVRAFNAREHLMIEAGTGVGKSLAYLIPAVNWAAANDTPVVVSTATRNLQSQLVGSDIPRAVKTVAGGNVRVALLKGRSNYLCLRSLGELMQDGYYAMTRDERAEFGRIVSAVRSDGCDGDLDGIDTPELKPRITCAGEDCGGRRCPYYAKCFVQKARDRALRAHLVVANHSLVLAEAANSGSGILPAYGRLIFDEAHNLEDIATDFFSFEFSQSSFSQIAARITRRQRGGRGREKGVLGAVQRQLDRGALASSKDAAALRSLVQSVRTATAFARLEADSLLECASRLFGPEPSAECIRYRREADAAGNAGCRQYSLHGLFRNYESPQWDEPALSEAFSRFESRLADVADALVKLAEMLGSDDDGEFNFFGDLSASAAAVAESVRMYLMETKFVLSGSDPEYVFWAERTRSGGAKTPLSIRLVGAPLSVAEEMRKCFYRMKDSVVLCSATLRVGDRFDYIAKRLGLADESGSEEAVARSRRLVASSPFDYFRQALVMAADFLPDPAAEAREYAAQLAEFLPRLFDATGGRGLVLFTAYEMMRETAEKARGLFENAGLTLLVQGDGMSRETMTAELKRGRRTVLFGAQSFWEGVDVAGDALSCVVIARLPFPQMGEPVTEARSAKIESEGGSSFRDYMVPEAVMKFRQGFGRLVRTKSDRGVVVIADRRVVSKNYGAIFRKSIASSVHAVSSPAEVCDRAAEFLGR